VGDFPPVFFHALTGWGDPARIKKPLPEARGSVEIGRRENALSVSSLP
jgi:hypothetical protein